jgi:pullulanase/glycogen debranching enzyme
MRCLPRCAADARLGVTFSNAGVPTFRVWAPTAKSVSLNVFADADAPACQHRCDDARQRQRRVVVHRAECQLWTNRYYYTYTVNVLSRWASNAIVSNTVTDPYSLSLNANGKRSFVANLASPALKPAGWDDHAIPKLDHPTDISLYELQVRDFSASDMTVPAGAPRQIHGLHRPESNGMRHLRLLQKAGMTHMHLLPSLRHRQRQRNRLHHAVDPERRRQLGRPAGSSGGRPTATASTGATIRSTTRPRTAALPPMPTTARCACASSVRWSSRCTSKACAW